MSEATLPVRPMAESACERYDVGTSSTCSLCGARYARAVAACSACPLHARCAVARCPHCGFSTPLRSRWVDWIRAAIGIPEEQRHDAK